jgi:excisionase family DNA binding protein
MKIASPYLTKEEACDYLRCPSLRAFYMFRYRRQLRAYRRGNVLLFKQADLDAALDMERPARAALKVVSR